MHEADPASMGPPGRGLLERRMNPPRIGVGRALSRVVMMLASLAPFACSDGSASENAELATGGNAGRGAAIIRDRGCGACHMIDGIAGAHGLGGPTLENFAARPYIARSLTNTPDQVVRWIMDPQAIDPKTVMPDLGLSEAEARDVTAYLYSQ